MVWKTKIGGGGEQSLIWAIKVCAAVLAVLAVLVINRVSILATLVINTCNRELSLFLIIDKSISNSPL